MNQTQSMEEMIVCMYYSTPRLKCIYLDIESHSDIIIHKYPPPAYFPNDECQLKSYISMYSEREQILINNKM